MASATISEPDRTSWSMLQLVILRLPLASIIDTGEIGGDFCQLERNLFGGHRGPF
jgi:hypothetical protein